jgi:hypothetical protein
MVIIINLLVKMEKFMKDQREEKLIKLFEEIKLEEIKPFEELDHIKTLKEQYGDKIVSTENTEIVIRFYHPNLENFQFGVTGCSWNFDMDPIKVILSNHSKYHPKFNSFRIKTGKFFGNSLLEGTISYVFQLIREDAAFDRFLKVETTVESLLSEQSKQYLQALNVMACQRNAKKRFTELLKEEKIDKSSTIRSVCFTDPNDIESFERNNYWSMIEYKELTTNYYIVISSIDLDTAFIFSENGKLIITFPMLPEEKEKQIKGQSLPQVLKILYSASSETLMWSPEAKKFKSTRQEKIVEEPSLSSAITATIHGSHNKKIKGNPDPLIPSSQSKK